MSEQEEKEDGEIVKGKEAAVLMEPVYTLVRLVVEDGTLESRQEPSEAVLQHGSHVGVVGCKNYGTLRAVSSPPLTI